ncbi:MULTISPECIES: FMN-binding negative transcriptional regulator [unclassified Roseitalea]|uniref:FMN-binding negative transcriptional regulator n=1 Tax=unclassified Roseitalea TaxID=2639107 RepID=UPI00273F78B3|nr:MULTISPECIES: FMN-binding negative transcriptional regulator [unclassified Roseitalea]
MFQPDEHRLDDPRAIAEAARAIQFACIVTSSGGALHASHVPCIVKHEDGATAVEFHLARANPHWKHAMDGPTIAIFQGEQAYIHPGWYPTKAETGKAVPTWNYVTVHLHGTLEAMRPGEELHRHLEELTDLNEAHRTEPWAISDAPERYIETMKRGIVGLRLKVTRAHGAIKLSQNKNDADHAGVVAGLTAAGGAAGSMAAQMADIRGRQDTGENQ